MTRQEQSQARAMAREETLSSWATEKAIDLNRFDDGQRWVLFAAVLFFNFLGDVPPLRRIAGYFLSHCGLELGSQIVAVLVGVSDRSVRSNQAFSPVALLDSVLHPVGGHRPPKLERHHAGPLAKFLVTRPRASLAEMMLFVQNDLGVSLERHTLSRFLEEYGLGCLRGDAVEATAPLLGSHSTAEPSSFSPQPSVS